MDLGKDKGAVSARDVSPSKTAVLAIHWQNDVLAPDGGFGQHFAEGAQKTAIVDNMARALTNARQLGMKVIYVNVVFNADKSDVIANNPLFSHVLSTGAFARGSVGTQIVDRLQPDPTDLVIEHNRISAFKGNILSSLLVERGIESLIVAGVATNVAVESTVRSAADDGYRVVVLKDCCAASNPQEHEAALKTMEIIATEVVDSGPFFDDLRSRYADCEVS
jgi:nicotinamidase-related amidase